MASADKLIRIILKLQDDMSSGLKDASNSIDKMGSKIKSIGDGMTSIGSKMTAGVTAPIVAAGIGIFKTFAEFENVMAELGARTGATAKEMEQMTKLAKEMGRDTSFSATQAADALLQLTSSGSSASEAMKQLPAVLDLAAAGALDLGTAADGVTDVLAIFQLEADDAKSVVDSLARAAGSSSATIADLNAALANGGPIAAQFGYNVFDTSAALAVFAESGIKGSEAGTQLRSMLLNMTNDTETVRGAWEELGVSMYDSAGNMRNIDDVFKDINKAMDGLPMNDQIRLGKALAGSYGILGFNALRASNGIQGMRDKMWDAASAGEVADARMNTLSGRFMSFMGSIETLAITLGGLGEGPLSQFLEMATQVVNSITTWAEANPKLAQTLMLVVGAIAAIGPVLVIVGTIISAIGSIVSAFSALGGAITAVSAALPVLGTIIGAVSLPILGLVAAVGALFVAFDQANKNKTWETWGNNFKMLGEIVKSVGAKAGQGLKDFGAKVQEGFANLPKTLQNAGQYWSQFGQKIVQALQTAAKVIFTVGQAIVTGLINGIKSKIQEWFNTIKQMASGAADIVKKALGIRSPSKVMQGFGQQVVAGFQKGIAQMGGMTIPTPQMAGATVGGGSTPTPTIGGGGGLASRGMGGGVYIENMNVPAGTSQEQIRYIMKEIGKEYKRINGK